MTWSEIGDVDAVIARALAEDLHAGDPTSRAVVPADAKGRARMVAREDLVMCGGPVMIRVFQAVDPALAVELRVADGARAAAGQVLLEVAGRARGILAAERTALNLLMRLCGVATMTRSYVGAVTEAAAGRCRVTDTRKTMPGLRALDRYAVRCGGGKNHRNDLGGGILVKGNHVRIAGSLRAAIAAVRAASPHGLRIECEVASLGELAEAISAGADIVMLDNMDEDQVAKAVALAAGRLVLEASGGMTAERAARMAALGVEVVSVGALTHSARAADIALELAG